MDDDRKKQLADFVAYAKTLDGDEKGEAQVFLDRLFRAFSRAGYKEAGATLEMRVENDRGGTSFADLVWKPVVLIEMKKRGEDLSRHLRQAIDYWTHLVPNRPDYVVLCNFDEFRIYDFRFDINRPQDTIKLDELPERYGPLNFMWPTNEAPVFKVDREKVTRAAADHLAAVYRRLAAKKTVGPATAQRFVLQALVCLFSEDIGLLPKHFFTQLLDDCIDPPKAFDLLDGLFKAMNARQGAKGGRFAKVPYFNGGIFVHSAAVELEPHHEVAILRTAASCNWSDVSPDIFGTIFQHSMDAEERHAFGAHYTAQEDIMRIVGPTIVYPFTTAIERATSIRELNGIRDHLTTLRVLDPACGSGNFLYIAYREMRRLEAAIVARQSEIDKKSVTGQAAFGHVSPSQFFGMDVLPFAVELAKVTLSLAPKLASDELHTSEKTLPLDNLDANIAVTDALITPSQREGAGGWVRSAWPKADVIIGNPPFLGAKRLKPERGADYVNAVRAAYAEVPGMADYCVYWFRRAHDHLAPCTAKNPFAGRAGLVGTQNIRNNQSRVGGLDHVVRSGTIVEAVENMPWSGEADVHVSIANWVKNMKVPLSNDDSSSPTPQPGGGGFEKQSNAPAKRGKKKGDKATPPPAAGGFSPADSGEDEGSSGDDDDQHRLVQSPRRLWSRVDPKLALFDQNGPSPRPKTVTRGRDGRVRKDKSYEMAVRFAPLISSALTDQVDISQAASLKCNCEPQRSFQGVVPGYPGFVLSLEERATMVKRSPRSAEVVRPFLIGRDMLTGGHASRAIVDFASMDLLEAAKFEMPFRMLKDRVLPHVRETASKALGTEMESARTEHLARWWQFWNVRQGMRRALNPLKRFLACSRVTKRPIFSFVPADYVPDNALQVFALDDEYSFGILQSDAHWQWFQATSSKLKADYRYGESVWQTFPWPQSPSARAVADIEASAREVLSLRANALKELKGGLRALYRLLDRPNDSKLRQAHSALDFAVCRAYGFKREADTLEQLSALNAFIAASNGEHRARGPGKPALRGDARDSGKVHHSAIARFEILRSARTRH